MQKITTALKNVQAFSLIMGMVFGVAVGLILYGGLTQGGDRMAGMYDNEMRHEENNKNEDVRLSASATSLTTGTPTTKQPVVANHYMMPPITSEKQFLREMKLHHEAAIKMSQQALSLSSLRPEVRALAKNIIATQSTEIKTMSDWITAWKY